MQKQLQDPNRTDENNQDAGVSDNYEPSHAAAAEGSLPSPAVGWIPAEVLLDCLLPGQPDLVDELLESVQEGFSWKKVRPG